jgi:hypothetical protein
MTKLGQTQPAQEGPAERRSRIPQFGSIEKEAEFWDTHPTSEFEDEFEEVSVDVRFLVTRGEPKKGITVRLTQDTFDALRREARARGIGPSTLARMSILEHLRRQTKHSDSKQSGLPGHSSVV